MDGGLLVLRAVLAVILFMHGTQKLFGWFNGPGRARSAISFSSMGHEPAGSMVILAAICEILAAISLASGVLWPLGVTVAGSVLLVAGLSLVLKSGNFFAAVGGGEYPIVLAVVAMVLGALGPGRWSLDWMIGVTENLGIGETSWWPAVIAIVASLPPLVRARHRLATLQR